MVSAPVAAGHHALEVAAAGSLARVALPPGFPPYQTVPIPGLVIANRWGLGHGRSVGLRLSGSGAVVDARFEVLRTPRLSLSVGAALGVSSAFLNPCPRTPHVDCGTPGLLAPSLVPLGSVPVVLGWQSRGATVFLGLRPGARLVGLGVADPRTDPTSSGVLVAGTSSSPAVNGPEPLVGALFGLDVPIGGDDAVELEVDISRSFVNPGTVTTLSLGIRN